MTLLFRVMLQSFLYIGVVEERKGDGSSNRGLDWIKSCSCGYIVFELSNTYLDMLIISLCKALEVSRMEF